MKKIALLILCLLAVNLVAFAQEHGKMGLRVAAGFSTLQDNFFKVTPIPAYSLGLFFPEKDKPFSIRYELAFESKGGYLASISEKVTLHYLSLCALSQFKFRPLYKHAITAGLYLSSITQVSREPGIYTASFGTLDMGANAGYKYQIFNSAKWGLQIDTRFSYGFVNINRNLYGRSTTTRTAAAQVGLNCIIGK